MSSILPHQKDELVSRIRTNLPSSLLESPIWIAYYFKKNKDGTYSKPPCKGYSVDEDKPGYPFNEVIKDGFPGIKINSSNPFIAFDIDDKEAQKSNSIFKPNDLPQPIKNFILKQQSYTEYSPSKCGLRVLFTCKDKSSLPGRVNLNKELCLGGELFTNSGYVTITGDSLKNVWPIKEITAAEVIPWFKKNGGDPEQPVSEEQQIKAMQQLSNLPPIETVLSALHACKLDQSASVKKAYETIVGQDYNHYDYWFRIMSAVHNYASLLGADDSRLVANILDWSETDTEAYVDVDDVLTHWSSLNNKENQVSYNTLFKFARLVRFNWPVEKMDKTGPTGKPLVNEIRNFAYLLDYYDIQVFHEPYTNGLYIEADTKTMESYFQTERTGYFFGKVGPFSQEEIIYKLWGLAQRNHYDNVTLSTIQPLAKAVLSEKVKSFNLMEVWLNTPYDELPAGMKEPDTDIKCSNLDYILSCIHLHPLQNKELTRKYLDAFFFGIVMPIYNPERIWPEHNFMLIFMGPENCRKSSFFSSLMPSQFKSYLITHSTETLSSAKSLRDFMIQMTSSALLVIDEFEIFYNRKNDSLFKTLVTCDSVDYIPIYSKMMVKATRTAALAGSTNKQKLPLEQDSSRRVALVEVDFLDTDALSKVNWHHFYRSYVKRGKKLLERQIYPWKLPQEDINLQYEENERFRAPTELEFILREMFDFDYEFPGLQVISSVQTDNTWLYSRNDIMGIMTQRYPSIKIGIPALVNTLEQLCGKYTHTTRTSKVLPHCKGTISKGVVKQAKYTRYFMPPRNTDFVPR